MRIWLPDLALLPVLMAGLTALCFLLYPLRRAALPAVAAAAAYVFAAASLVAAAVGLASPNGFAVRGPLWHVGASGFAVTPRLYLDPRNALFVLLLGLCAPVVFTFLRDREGRYGKGYYLCAWAMIAALAGVFTADSLLLLYFFWEAALIAVYFWIGRYGRPGYHVASVYPILLRFVLFTLAGSLPMLFSIAAVCAADLRDPGVQGLAEVVGNMDPGLRHWVFAGFFLGFAVKLPLLGFHGWLRDTYNAAPPACRALLSAAMSKMGAYGLILILAPCFPEEMQHYAPALEVLAVMGIVYGALLTLVQERLIDLLAYASLSHLSLLALGVFASAQAGDAAASGLSGAVLLAFSHGLIMVMLFSLDARVQVGAESPDKGLLSGLRPRQRRLAAVLLLSVFASASLPGLSNFAGELLVYFTTFQVSPLATFFAAAGALIGAAALLRTFHAIFFGQPAGPGRAPAKLMPDLDAGETALSLGMAALWLVVGLYPMLLLHPLERAMIFLNPICWTS